MGKRESKWGGGKHPQNLVIKVGYNGERRIGQIDRTQDLHWDKKKGGMGWHPGREK